MTLADTRANVSVFEDADKSPGLTKAEAQRERRGSSEDNSLDSRGGGGRHLRHDHMVVSRVTVALSQRPRAIRRNDWRSRRQAPGAARRMPDMRTAGPLPRGAAARGTGARLPIDRLAVRAHRR